MSHFLFFLLLSLFLFLFFFFNDTATTEIYTLSLHDALPIFVRSLAAWGWARTRRNEPPARRSEEHTSELQSLRHLVCRLLLEKKKQTSYALQQQKRKRRKHILTDVL